MIVEDHLPPLQTIIDRSGEPFGNWAIRNTRNFFLPKREPNYSLDAIIHIFMTRLHQPYHQIMLMDEERRDALLKTELAIMKKESEANKGK